MNVQSGGLVAQFIAGLIAGILVLVGELEVFAASLIAYAFSKAMQTLPTTTFSIYIFLFIIVDIMQNFLVGFASPTAFAIGFLFGDLLLLLFIAVPLWAIVPSIVIGMIGALITVVAGLIFRRIGTRT